MKRTIAAQPADDNCRNKAPHIPTTSESTAYLPQMPELITPLKKPCLFAKVVAVNAFGFHILYRQFQMPSLLMAR